MAYAQNNDSSVGKQTAIFNFLISDRLIFKTYGISFVKNLRMGYSVSKMTDVTNER